MTILEVGDYLQAQGLGTVGTDLFYGSLPDTPVACVAIKELPGQPPQAEFGGPAWERPRLEIIVRGTSYFTGRQQAEAVYRALLGITNETLSGTFYLSAEPQTPEQIGRDEHEHERFAVHCLFQKALSSLS